MSFVWGGEKQLKIGIDIDDTIELKWGLLKKSKKYSNEKIIKMEE